MINFGLNDDQNYKLLPYINSDTISRLNIDSYQIDLFSSQLNWDILSNKNLSNNILYKYSDLINWDVFLKNPHPKSLHFLVFNKDKVIEHYYVFESDQIKKKYYSNDFIYVFDEIIDWKWCVKNIKLDKYILEIFTHKMSLDAICKYQNIPEKLITKYSNIINWRYLSKNKYIAPLLEKYKDKIYWKEVCKYQTLSVKFIKDNMKHLFPDIISRYQNLPFDFIKENLNWVKLDMLILNKKIKNKIHIYKNINYFILDRESSEILIL
jgi:hypothetical protein